MGGVENFGYQQGLRMAGDALAAQANVQKAKQEARAIEAGAKASEFNSLVGGLSGLASAGLGQLGASAAANASAGSIAAAGSTAGARAFAPGFDASRTWQSAYSMPSYRAW